MSCLSITYFILASLYVQSALANLKHISARSQLLYRSAMEAKDQCQVNTKIYIRYGEEDFERFNIERVPFLTNIRLSVESTTQGNYVTLTSDQIVSESDLSFVLETRWPNGRSLSIHTLLLDLPVFQDDQMEEVRASISTILEPSQDAQSTVTQPFTNPDLAILSSIASRVRPDTSVSIEQTMLAIQELNPNIFVDDNTNQIRSGQVLRVPTLGEIQAIDARETINDVNLQNQQVVDQQPLVD